MAKLLLAGLPKYILLAVFLVLLTPSNIGAAIGCILGSLLTISVWVAVLVSYMLSERLNGSGRPSIYVYAVVLTAALRYSEIIVFGLGPPITFVMVAWPIITSLLVIYIVSKINRYRTHNG